MPKMKTHRGAAKRFRLTATGKVVRRRAGKSHILEKKSAKRKRRLGKETLVGPTFAKNIKRMLCV